MSADRHFIITPPAGSCSGRFALLQAWVSGGGYPDDEDQILLARREGELFRPVFMVRVPFDESPLVLLEDVEHPGVAVVHQHFTLAWTDDGGRTIQHPPRRPEGLFALHRFGGHWIGAVQIHGEHLYVTMRPGGHLTPKRDEFAVEEARAWRFRIDGRSERADLVDPPIVTPARTMQNEIPVRGGNRLEMRASAEAAWVEIPFEQLVEQLKSAERDFFGGTGARFIAGRGPADGEGQKA